MIPDRDTPARGRFWLILMALTGTLMLSSLFSMLGGLTPPALFLLLFVVFVVIAVWAVFDFAGPVLNAPDPRVAPAHLYQGQVWRDRSASGELVEIVSVLPYEAVVITRIAGSYPTSHGKLFRVRADALRTGFEPVE